MTYLEIVNKVLRLLREDEADTVQVTDDVVVAIVSDFVNDAKRLVEDTHDWNALRTSWVETLTPENQYVSLTNSGKSARIEYIRSADKPLRESTNAQLENLQLRSSTSSSPIYYAVSGLDASNDLRLRLYPTPDTAETITVTGFRKQDDLSADADVLLVPAQPVVYYALAFAARERGEVGGQTAAEVFAMAKQFLNNAISYDAALNQLEYDWYTV